MLILLCCLLREGKAPAGVTSSSLTYLQHWSQSLIHLILLLLPSTRQQFKGPPNPFTLGARTLRHHVSTTKGEHGNLLELLPDGSVRRSEPSNTSQSSLPQRAKRDKSIKSSAVKRNEEVETLPCSFQVWSTHSSLSMLSDQQTGSQRQSVWRNSLQEDLSEAAYREGRLLQRANQLRQLTVCCQHSDAAPPPSPPPSILPFPPIF